MVKHYTKLPLPLVTISQKDGKAGKTTLSVFLMLFFLMGWNVSQSQISITSGGTPYTQDFDSMGATGTTTPTGWFVGTGSSASSTTVVANDGFLSGGGNFNYGNTPATERALGSIASNTAGTRNTEARFTNNTGSPIVAITVSYEGEQWYLGQTNNNETGLIMKYSTNGTTFTTMGTSYNFVPPITTGAVGPLNGNAAANRVAGIGGTYIPSTPIAVGATFYLRWVDTNDAGNDSGNAVDNFSLTVKTAQVAVTDNGTQVAAANANQGATNVILNKIKLDVTNSNAVLTGMTCVTTGTYQVADLVNLKVRYSPDETLNSTDGTLSVLTSGLTTAGTQAFPNFISQTINSGTSGYIFITADIINPIDLQPRTIGVNAIGSDNMAFSNAIVSPTPTTTDGGLQTFKDITAPTLVSRSPANGATNVAVDTNLVITFNENVKAGTSGEIRIYKTIDNNGIQTEVFPFNSPLMTFSGTTVTINLTNNLEYSKGYSVAVNFGVIKDTQGVSYPGGGTWDFTTELPPCSVNAGTNGTLTVCSGTTPTNVQLFAALGGSPQTGGTWTGPVAGVYTYTVTSAAPCVGTASAAATVTVTSQALPNAGSNGSLTICSGTTVTASQLFAQLTGTPSAGGTWTPALAGAGTYTYHVAATSPCTIEATSQVVVTAVSCQAAQLSNCGNTPVLTSVNDRIFAGNTVTTATKYRFRVAKSTAPTTYFYAETTYPSFRLTDVVGLTPTYGTTYNVDIQNEFLISGQTVTSAYGPMCTVTTQAATNITVPTNQCGQTLAAVNSRIYVNGITGATMYTFRVAKQSAPTTYSYIDSPYSNFRLTNPPTSGTVSIEHNTVYLVAVSVTTASGSSNFNGECIITTPAGPVTTLQASQCGDEDAPYVIPTKSTKVYAADLVSGATYTFRLEQYDSSSNLVATKFATSPINYFDCNMFTGLNSLLPNTKYHAYVSVNYYGAGPYDHDCVIQTPAALKQVEMNQQFSAVAYPNPFANNFMVNVKSSSQSVVNLKVYDMIGRLIDQRDVKMPDLETTTIGTNYPSGVYNVVVSQESSVEMVRVIKR